MNQEDRIAELENRLRNAEDMFAAVIREAGGKVSVRDWTLASTSRGNVWRERDDEHNLTTFRYVSP